MSKKKKKKFKHPSLKHNQSNSPQSYNIESTAHVLSQVQPIQAIKNIEDMANVPAGLAHTLAPEYKVIRNDLIKVFIVNLIILVGILLLYYYNSSTNYLDKLLSQFIK